MASDSLHYMVDQAPPRGTQVTLGALHEVGGVGREIKAEQKDMTRGTIMIKKALAICRPFKPEASLLNILWRPTTKGPREHSLRTGPGLFLVSHLIAEEDVGCERCPLFTLRKNKFPMCKHDERHVFSAGLLTNSHTAVGQGYLPPMAGER